MKEQLKKLNLEPTIEQPEIVSYRLPLVWQSPKLNPIIRLWQNKLQNDQRSREFLSFYMNKNTAIEKRRPRLDIVLSSFFILDESRNELQIDIGTENEDGRKTLHADMRRVSKIYWDSDKHVMSGHLATSPSRPIAFALIDCFSGEISLLKLDPKKQAVCQTLLVHNVLPISGDGHPLLT